MYMCVCVFHLYIPLQDIHHVVFPPIYIVVIHICVCVCFSSVYSFPGYTQRFMCYVSQFVLCSLLIVRSFSPPYICSHVQCFTPSGLNIGGCFGTYLVSPEDAVLYGGLQAYLPRPYVAYTFMCSVVLVFMMVYINKAYVHIPLSD